MRVGLFSDVHGNAVGFDALLADLERCPVDRLVCLGDVAQGGPQPAECLERRGPAPRIDEVLAFKTASNGASPDLVVCEAHEKIGAAIELMQRYGISQLPVVRHAPVESLADVIGSLNERGLLDRVFRQPDSLGEDVAAAMGPPLPAVDANDSVDDVFADLSGGGAAVVVVRGGKPLAVVTRSDLLEYLARRT